MQNNKVGSGLSNLGNTCFFNAVMQVIMHSQPFANQLKQKNHSNNCKKNDWCIFCQMQILWKQSKQSRVVNPRNIVSHLKTIFKKFRLGRQQDSHQYLRYLIEGMQEAETGKLGKDRQNNQKRIKQTIIYRVFGGRLRTFVLCLGCNHKSLTQERYYDINIECQKSNSLHQGLNNYFKKDYLKGANKYRCQKCQKLNEAQKGFSILTLPNVLTFQLKRFTNTLRKIGKHISFPKHLNMQRYMANSHIHQDQCRYQLYGVTVHAGSSSYSGHYYSFIKTNLSSNDWFEMNDSNVSKSSQERVLNQNAYLLFYVRTKNSKPILDLQKCQIVSNIEMEQKSKEDKKIIKIIQKQQKKQKFETGSLKKQMKEQIKQQKSNEKQSKSLVNLEQAKRKLSSDLDSIKKSLFNDKSQQNSVKQNVIINGHPIPDKKFGDQLPKQKQSQFNQQILNGKPKKKIKKQLSESSLQPPNGLLQKRSKQQALSQTPLQVMLLKYSLHLLHLKNKIPKNGIGYRAMRSITTLRKKQFELTKHKVG